MDRRKFIERVCATTAVTSAGLAGCTSFGGGDTATGGSDGGDGIGDGSSDGGSDGNSDGGDGSDSGDGGTTGAATSTPTPTAPSQTVAGGARAPYDDWASTETYASGEVGAFSVRAGTGQTSSQTATPTPTPQGTQAPVDPILGYPTGFLLTALFSGFALSQFGLGQVAAEDGGTERIHSAGNGLVFEGSFDTETLTSAVGESRATESGSYEGFTVYGVGSGDSRAVLGLSGEALVHASADEQVSDPRAAVESTIDAGLGNATAYGNEHPAYEDLVTALPTGPIMGLTFSTDGGLNQGTPTPTPTPSMGGGSGSFFEIRDFDLGGTVRGLASGLTYGQNQESATAEMAIRYASAGEVDSADTIQSQIAPQAGDASVAISGSLAVVTANYTEADV
jgi:hypothetical protein